MPKFASNIDLAKNELQNARIQNLSAAPSAPVEGQIYHNTTDHHDYVWNGSSWQQLDGVPTHNHDTAYQAKENTLTSLGQSGNGILAKTSTGTITPRTITAGTGISVTSGDGIAGNPSIALASGVVSPGTATKVTFDTYGRVTNAGALAATDIPTLDHTKVSDFDTQVRSSRLDQMAAPAADVSMNSKRITNVAAPTSAGDAANKQYVDDAVQGLDAKQSVACATIANIPSILSCSSPDAYTDGAGSALYEGCRILVKDQSNPAENGIYKYDGTGGALVRASDMNAWSEFPGAYVFVEDGPTYGNSGWVCTVEASGSYTLGTTPITWVQFSGAGQITAGAGLTKNGNTIDIGAGTGITVNADSIAVTNPKLKCSADSTATNPWVITHNFGTTDVIVAVYEGNNEVMCDVARTSVNQVSISFSATPAMGQYRAVILG